MRTIRSAAVVLMAAALAGCGSRPQAAEPPPEPVVAVVPHIKPDLGPPPAPSSAPPDAKVVAVAPQPAAEPLSAPAAPAPFRLPDDVGGKKVADVLAPSLTPAPVLPGATGPKPRTSAVERGDAPLPKVTVAIPSAPPPQSKPPKPTPPPERVPLSLDSAALADPSLARLPDPPLVRGAPLPTASAADVPLLAAPLPSRAPVTDPTAELSAARVVLTELPLPFHPGWFVRFGIPDPFELADHVRGRTGVNGELGTVPVTVSPAKP